MNKGGEGTRFPKRVGPQFYTTNWLGLRVTVMDGMGEHRRLEEYGLELIRRAHILLRYVLFDQLDDPATMEMAAGTPRGPDFDFTTSHFIFAGRWGSGPLYIAWDTNILIDYFEHGAAIWTDDKLPDEMEDDLQSELECLQFIFALWAIRDIRFIVLPEVVDDAKKKLSREGRRRRIRALVEFTQALQLVSAVDPEEEIPRDGLLNLPDSVRDAALAKVPAGLDRRMITAAHRRGAHVFLTRDRGVLRAAEAFHPLGLTITSPGELFENLLVAGAFNCILNPHNSYWPLPDQQRVAHLIRALPDYEL
jgi:hypothetical protein